MKKILIVSHCILNKASKVAMDESDLAEEYEVRDRLLKLIIEKDVQLIQLPCPEFLLFGSKRWGHVRDQFDFPYFRKSCRDMLELVLLQLREYANHPERFHILGVVSVEGSPSCGMNLTCRGEWGGELDGSDICSVVDTLEMKEEPGVFMEELNLLLAENNLDIPIISMNEAIEVVTNC